MYIYACLCKYTKTDRETDKENHKTNVIKCQNLDNLKGI